MGLLNIKNILMGKGAAAAASGMKKASSLVSGAGPRLHVMKQQATFLRGFTGAAIGGYAGYKKDEGAGGALMGATAGLGLGFAAPWMAKKAAQGVFFGALKHPKLTAGVGFTALSAYSFGKPIVGSPLLEQRMNRPTNPAINTRGGGPGYVTLGNSPRIRTPHNNLGATGDLTLSMHKLRHGRR